MSGSRRKPGALGPFVEAYRSRLLAEGYTPQTVRGKLKELGQLGRWMSGSGVRVDELDEERIEEFGRDRRSAGHRRVPTVRSFALLLSLLRERGLISPLARPALSPVEELVEEYRRWLLGRGLAEPTVLRYEKLAVRFLSTRCPDPAAGPDMAGVDGQDVADFLLAECGRVSVGAAKGRVAELRSLLRWLFVEGRIDVALGDAVPPVAGWHDVGVPQSLDAADVEALLASCDVALPTGRRDLAILTLLARLGLRSAEVARLELDDLDWTAGEIIISGKGRRQDRLPMPVDVGEALVGYLTADRPDHPSRRVMLTVRPPRRPIRPDLVSDVVRRACRRAGLPPVCAHRLRHALATTMLQRGVGLLDISQVLGHRDLATTGIYAKIDLAALRQVARPWPGDDR